MISKLIHMLLSDIMDSRVYWLAVCFTIEATDLFAFYR